MYKYQYPCLSEEEARPSMNRLPCLVSQMLRKARQQRSRNTEVVKATAVRGPKQPRRWFFHRVASKVSWVLVCRQCLLTCPAWEGSGSRSIYTYIHIYMYIHIHPIGLLDGLSLGWPIRPLIGPALYESRKSRSMPSLRRRMSRTFASSICGFRCSSRVE